jgi:hypothetical protein
MQSTGQTLTQPVSIQSMQRRVIVHGMGAYPLLKAVTGLAYYGVVVQKSVSAAQGQSSD